MFRGNLIGALAFGTAAVTADTRTALVSMLASFAAYLAHQVVSRGMIKQVVAEALTEHVTDCPLRKEGAK